MKLCFGAKLQQKCSIITVQSDRQQRDYTQHFYFFVAIDQYILDLWISLFKVVILRCLSHFIVYLQARIHIIFLRCHTLQFRIQRKGAGKQIQSLFSKISVQVVLPTAVDSSISAVGDKDGFVFGQNLHERVAVSSVSSNYFGTAKLDQNENNLYVTNPGYILLCKSVYSYRFTFIYSKQIYTLHSVMGIIIVYSLAV